MLPNVSGLRLDEPPSVGTNEFYALSQPEVDALNAGGGKEAFTLEEFQQNAEPVEGWHGFRVRAEHPRPDGTYNYQYYRAESLWRWVQAGNKVDPITRGPIWYEDYVELHDRFAPGTPVPLSARQLRRKDAPVPPAAPPQPAGPPSAWQMAVPYADSPNRPTANMPEVLGHLLTIETNSDFLSSEAAAASDDLGIVVEARIAIESSANWLIENWGDVDFDSIVDSLTRAARKAIAYLRIASPDLYRPQNKVIFFLYYAASVGDIREMILEDARLLRMLRRWIDRNSEAGYYTDTAEYLLASIGAGPPAAGNASPQTRSPNPGNDDTEPLFDDEDPDFDREPGFVDLSAGGEDPGDELLRDVWFSARRVFRDQDSMTEQLIELNSALSRLLNNWERLGINATSAVLLQAVAVCQDVLTFPSGWTGNWLLLKGKVIDFFYRATTVDSNLIDFLNRRPDNARAVERWIPLATLTMGMYTHPAQELIRRLEYAAMPSGVPPSQRRLADEAAHSPQRSPGMTAGTNVHDSSWGSNRTNSPPRSQSNRPDSLSRAAAVPAQISDFDEAL